MDKLTNRQKQGIRTKNRIYKHALDLFLKKGFNEVRIIDICKSANVSVGVFYHYFKNKEEILNESYEDVFNKIIDETMKRNENKSINNLKFALSLYGKRISEKGIKYTEIFLANELSRKDDVFKSKKNLFTLIKIFVDESIDKKELIGDSDDIAFDIFKVTRGNTYFWVLKSDTVDLEKSIMKSLDIIIKHYSK